MRNQIIQVPCDLSTLAAVNHRSEPGGHFGLFTEALTLDVRDPEGVCGCPVTKAPQSGSDSRRPTTWGLFARATRFNYSTRDVHCLFHSFVMDVSRVNLLAPSPVSGSDARR